MRVAIVNTGTTGGAAIAAMRLHEGLRSIDIDSRFICRDATSIKEQIYSTSLHRRSVSQIASSFVKHRLGVPDRSPQYGLSDTPKRPACELFSDCRSAVGRRRSFSGGPFDIINLHWISQFLDLETVLKTYAGKVPIVWTLHDMNAMTGGCHYDAECGKFFDRCFECPHLRLPGPNDSSNSIFQDKKRIFASIDPEDLHFVTPSRWLAEQAQRSKLLSRFPVSVIPNGLDTDLFRPISAAASRESLGIPLDDQVILFVAESINNPRKGIDLLSEALRSTRFDRSTTLLCVGRGSLDLPQIENVKSLHLGPVTNPHFMPLIYSAADLFVIPSRQDNLPNTILESLSCGTPVVGFSIGGIPDLVANGETGWLGESLDGSSLGKAIATGLAGNASPDASPKIRQFCREFAAATLSLQRQAENYRNLFNSLLAN